ncbi:hypothetical protein WME73_05820 [Sorangium sp. So ce302]|uniref:hypothetical protein n=1 Tax=Sorangium sp. So ce302 TaxID=3133297 RepID=UPI003F601E97
MGMSFAVASIASNARLGRPHPRRNAAWSPLERRSRQSRKDIAMSTSMTQYASVDEISSADWEQVSKVTNLPVAELQKRYQEFVNKNPGLIKNKQVRHAPVETGAKRDDINLTPEFDIWIASFKGYIRGYVENINDFDLRWGVEVKAFGITLASEERRLSPQNPYVDVTLGFDFLHVNIGFGLRGHQGHMDIYTKGRIKYIFGSEEWNFVIAHL